MTDRQTDKSGRGAQAPAVVPVAQSLGNIPVVPAAQGRWDMPVVPVAQSKVCMKQLPYQTENLIDLV